MNGRKPWMWAIVLFAAAMPMTGGCATPATPPSPATVPNPAEKDPVSTLAGVDSATLAEWEHRSVMHVMYTDRCEELGVGYSIVRLDPPWHGFDKALAWGEDGTKIVQGVNFRREEAMSFDWRAWAEDVVRTFREDFGMELRLLEPMPGYEGYDAQYAGGEGEWRAVLAVGSVLRFEADGIRIKSKTRSLEVEVRRVGSTLPAPDLPFEK